MQKELERVKNTSEKLARKQAAMYADMEMKERELEDSRAAQKAAELEKDVLRKEKEEAEKVLAMQKAELEQAQEAYEGLVDKQAAMDADKEVKERKLEESRAARKAAEQGEGYKPKWFTLAPGSNPKKWKFDSTFHYTDEYWQARETGDFGRCQDIFG